MSLSKRLGNIRLLVSCAFMLPAASLHSAPASVDIKVTDAWIRWLPAGVPAGGYMTLTNTGAMPHTLVSARSADYAEASIHKTENSHGVSSMRPVDSIEIKPMTSLKFAETGYHLMLMKPVRELHPGDKVLIALQFLNEPPMTVPFVVCVAGSKNAECKK